MSSNPQVTIGVSAVDTARQTLQQVDDKIRQTTSIVEDSGARINSVSDKIKQNWQNLAATATGLTAGVVGFATSFDVLEKAQTRADKANLTLEKSQARLNEMQESGKYSAEELARQQEEVRINSEKLAQAQDALGDTYTNFLANIPGQMLGFGTAAISMFQMLRTTQTAMAASSVASSVTYSGALTSMNAATGAATAGMHGFRLASIAAFITNPVGLAIIGISTVVMLLVTHFDQLVAAAKAVADFFTGVFSPAAKTARDSLDGLKASVSETITVSDSLQVSVKRAADETAAQTGRMAGSWQKLTSDLEIEVIKQETLYKRIANPIGPDLRVPVAAANPFAGMAVPSMPSGTITPPAGWSSGSAPLGTLAGNTNYLNSISGVKKNALGGEGMVYQPTLFLAGENGPEGFKFTPGRATGGDDRPMHIHFEVNGREIAHAIIDDITTLQAWRTRIMAKTYRQTIAGAPER
jgi:hypothetical protein